MINFQQYIYTMKNTFIKFGTLIVIAGMVSCSPTLTPFTQKLYQENNWTENDLKKIQFYVSRDIVLWREASSGVSQIANGKIKVVKGKKIEEVTIRRGTSGVFLFSPKENRFAISFEAGDDSRFLIFGPNPKLSNSYVLLGSDWERGTGIVHYDETSYYTDANSGMATLLVDLNRSVNVSRQGRVARGRTVNN